MQKKQNRFRGGPYTALLLNHVVQRHWTYLVAVERVVLVVRVEECEAARVVLPKNLCDVPVVTDGALPRHVRGRLVDDGLHRDGRRRHHQRVLVDFGGWSKLCSATFRSDPWMKV